MRRRMLNQNRGVPMLRSAQQIQSVQTAIRIQYGNHRVNFMARQLPAHIQRKTIVSRIPLQRHPHKVRLHGLQTLLLQTDMMKPRILAHADLRDHILPVRTLPHMPLDQGQLRPSSTLTLKTGC